MSWSTTDTTALESKVLIQFMTIDLCDTFNNEIIYTNYLSNCKVLVSLGEYTTPGDPNSFNLEENKGNYAGNSLGTPMEFMLDRGEEKFLDYKFLLMIIQDLMQLNIELSKMPLLILTLELISNVQLKTQTYTKQLTFGLNLIQLL